MTPEFIVGFGKEAVWITLLIAGPMLFSGLIVGLIVSIFQAVTQVHEMTLTFIPKILAVMAALVFFSPWMMSVLLNFTERLFINIPMYIR
jgi:flagellar biosynthetic protein FliQ